MDIAIVGAGTVGTAVAVAWTRAGHRITAVSGRSATAERAASWLPGVPVRPIEEATAGAEVVVLGVPDDALPATVADLASDLLPDTWVVCLSGAAGLEALAPAGARPLMIHPLQTFPDVAGAIDALTGCAVAVTAADDEGWALGEQLAADLGGMPFRLRDEQRALYHAAAVFASNYLVAISGVAQQLFALADVPQPAAAMRPLQLATLDNVARLGPRDALTGPAVRGDAGTVDRNLRAIAGSAPSLVPSYVELCRVALDVAGSRISDDGRARVEEVLARWS